MHPRERPCEAHQALAGQVAAEPGLARGERDLVRVDPQALEDLPACRNPLSPPCAARSGIASARPDSSGRRSSRKP